MFSSLCILCLFSGASVDSALTPPVHDVPLNMSGVRGNNWRGERNKTDISNF